MDGFQSLSLSIAPVTVLIASPAALLRCGLKHVLLDARAGWTVHEVDTFDAALAASERCAFDVVLLDCSIVPQGRLSTLVSLRGEARIIIMGDADSRAEVLGWISAGAHGYLARTADQAQLMCSIEAVMLNNVFVPSVLIGPAEHAASPRDLEVRGGLTDRQQDVLELIMQGCSTKAIARELDIAVATVKIHLAAIYRVLGAHSRLEAMVKAREGGARPAAAARPQAPPARTMRDRVLQRQL